MLPININLRKYEGMIEVDVELEAMKKTPSELAVSYFREGYNCSQSVFLAFCEEYGMDFDTALKISSSFGAGMGRLREVCGAVTGMFMVAGIIYGYTDPKDQVAKSQHYERIQLLAKEFEERNHSIICRDLLGLGAGKDSPVPELRTAEYYKKRPCVELVGMAAEIMDNYIQEHRE
jgi:C_GCAxxG_C_C family probable redox protein